MLEPDHQELNFFCSYNYHVIHELCRMFKGDGIGVAWMGILPIILHLRKPELHGTTEEPATVN